MLWCASNGSYAPSSALCASGTSCNPRTVENTVGPLLWSAKELPRNLLGDVGDKFSRIGPQAYINYSYMYSRNYVPGTALCQVSDKDYCVRVHMYGTLYRKVVTVELCM